MTDFKFADYNPNNLVPKYQVRRFDDKNGNRFYYYWDENGELIIAAGITSWLKEVKPESKYMTNWKIDIVKSGLDWKDVLNTYADYGTIMHSCFADIMIKGKPDEVNIGIAREICIKNGKNPDMIYKDCLAFVKWVQDYNVEPLLIEAIVPCQSNDKGNYAMTIDLLCKIDSIAKEETWVQDGVYVRGDKKGQPKMVKNIINTRTRITALVDFKSNFGEKERKSYYDDHKFQLIAAKKAVHQNFGIVANAVYNFSPNNWTKEPTYTFYEHKLNFEDYTEFDLLERLANVRNAFEPSGKFTEYEDITSSMDLTKIYKTYTYKEYILKNTEILSQ